MTSPMITWGHNSEPHEWPSRIDRAISAGFDPHEPPDEPKLGPITPAMARRVHQSAPTGCHDCGHRCDYCDDRMCAKWGPAPEPTCGAHQVCEDCAADNHCRECATARREAS